MATKKQTAKAPAKAAKVTFVYSKIAEPYPKTLHRLWKKGLMIDNRLDAESALKTIGYYRLLIYMRHFQSNVTPRDFRPKTKFSYIVQLYNFDREIRLLTLNAIEKLEVALRTAIINPLAEQHTPHWYLDPSHFGDDIKFHGVMGKIIQGASVKKGLALTHYFDKYHTPVLPPIWLVCEKLTFGALSRFFEALKIDRRKIVARYIWSYPEHLLVSWFHALAHLRNICAHQDRLWNNPITAFSPESHKTYSVDFTHPTTFYCRAVVIQLLMRELGLNGWWRDSLRALLASCAHVDPRMHLGFPNGWDTGPVWA
jgi:abortive infection bacteriophage resistance protein